MASFNKTDSNRVRQRVFWLVLAVACCGLVAWITASWSSRTKARYAEIAREMVASEQHETYKGGQRIPLDNFIENKNFS